MFILAFFGVMLTTGAPVVLIGVALALCWVLKRV